MREIYWGRRQLDWYGALVHNRSVAGSLVTLLHLPFMAAFLAFVAIGAFVSPFMDGGILLLSLLAVALMLYGEHMLDDTTMVGKPWGTVFGDQTLVAMAMFLFALAAGIGLFVSTSYSNALPFAGVMVGILFSVLYGLEVWKFHTVEFGALGMGAIPAFSYLAQTMVAGTAPDYWLALLLLLFGITYAYVLLALYENTKTDERGFSWKVLGYHFVTIYALAAVVAVVFLR